MKKQKSEETKIQQKKNITLLGKKKETNISCYHMDSWTSPTLVISQNFHMISWYTP